MDCALAQEFQAVGETKQTIIDHLKRSGIYEAHCVWRGFFARAFRESLAGEAILEYAASAMEVMERSHGLPGYLLYQNIGYKQGGMLNDERPQDGHEPREGAQDEDTGVGGGRKSRGLKTGKKRKSDGEEGGKKKVKGKRDGEVGGNKGKKKKLNGTKKNVKKGRR